MRSTISAGDLHVSERQLRRRFLAAVGIGPATFRRVVRLQRLVALAATVRRRATLARLAVDAGYADQSQLARDARSLAGVTPERPVRRGG